MLAPHEIERAAIARFGNPNRSLSTKTDLRFGHKGSISVRLTGPKGGAFFDHESQKGGWLDNANGPHERIDRRIRYSADTNSSESFARIIKQLSSATGTPAEAYMRSRGISHWPDHSVRFSSLPAGLFGIAQDAAGYPRAGQLVYLTPDGRKADLAVKKRTYTACEGWHEISACHLPGSGEPILCEGLETGLSVWNALDRRRPVLVCFGLAGIRFYRTRTKRVTIARDGDAPGSPADQQIQKAKTERSRRQRVLIATPPEGMDFNDILQSNGAEEVARIIRNATK